MEAHPDSEGVVLLHGIFRSSRNMSRLAGFLADQGYRTLNLDYPSTGKDLAAIAEHIHPEIAGFADSVSRIHFLGFSMGGLVIRAYLNRFRPKNLGRVVMLGTPNNGSEIADLLRDWRLYRKYYGPAGQQMVTNLEHAESLFGTVDYELGILAGNWSIDPFSAIVIGKPSDGKVSVESTRLAGMKDHLVMGAFHTFFPNTRRAWRQALHFLKNGSFSRPKR